MTAVTAAVAAERLVTVGEATAPQECDAYVAAHPEGTSYHRTGWLEVIRHAFGHETRYLTAHVDGRLAGVLPLVLFNSRLFGRFAVSVPFVNYGGVLADDAAIEQALVDRAIDVTRAAGGSHLELRHGRQHFSALAAKRHKVAMHLPLRETADAQWLALDKKIRNQVRKAEKSGLTVQVGGLDLLPMFYEVFARNMRDLGTPVYSPAFFREVLTVFRADSRILVVLLSGRPIAASLVHAHGRTIEVPWASSIREFNPLCGNVLLYWHMLRFSIESGMRVFDFGRSTPGESTFHFKKQWGAEPRELVWEYWMADGRVMPELNPANPKFALAIRTWQRLPLGVANRLGPLVVRNIP